MTACPSPVVFARREGVAARLARRWFRARFRLLHARRYRRPDLARVGGLSLTVVPGVFHPEFFFATALFLHTLARRPLRPGLCALDMGTGSGALAVALGRRDACVTAIDINPLAVSCARANLLAHGLSKSVSVLEGDLFAPLGDERFDLITFNPPFYPRTPRNMADRAWAAGVDCEVLRRFLDEAPSRLNEEGEVLISGSTEAAYTADLVRAPGWRVRIIGRRELVGELLFIFAMRPR
jgi:release factor glutamine methyltransferase